VRKRIVQRDGVPAVAIPPKLLEELGLSLGDEVDLQIIDGALLITPIIGVLDEGELNGVLQDLLTRRSELYAVLGE
jgi:antitoxin component of MazEF toxin-antitoxin module